LQRGAEEDGSHLLLSLDNTKKMSHRRRTKDVQQSRFHLRVLFYSRQRKLVGSMSVHREIQDGQADSSPGLWVYPQQELVRKLIPRRCGRLPEGNIQDVSVRIIGDTDGL
jgi:hypothetical protein